MNANDLTAIAKAEVRAVLDQWQEAVRAKDLEGIVAHYAPDIVAYDAIVALQFVGRDAYREHWATCLKMCTGPMIFELRDPQVAAAGDVAFCHALTRCGGTGPDGKECSGWMRMTACYRKRDGRWLVVHEHFSAPFDMETNKMLELEP